MITFKDTPAADIIALSFKKPWNVFYDLPSVMVLFHRSLVQISDEKRLMSLLYLCIFHSYKYFSFTVIKPSIYIAYLRIGIC